jgi:hypothetical protein
MRTKTRYRKAYRDGGRVEQSTEEPPQPQPVDAPADMSVNAASAPQPEPPPPAPQPPPITPPGDDGINALKAQLAALQQSEALERQQQQAAAVHGQRLAWLQGNPLAMKFHDRLDSVHQEAIAQGRRDMSEEYFTHLETRLREFEAQPPAPAPQPQPTPQFFEPPSAPRPSAPPPPSGAAASNFSAPVSREIPNGSGKRRSSSQITLTAAEVDAARTAGISVEEYARQKVRRDQMVESGEYRNQDQR